MQVRATDIICMLHYRSARLTAERRHYKNFKIADLKVQAVYDQVGNRALRVKGRGLTRLIYASPRECGPFSNDHVKFCQLASGRIIQKCYSFNQVLVYPLGKKPVRIPLGFINRVKANLKNRNKKKAWLSAQARHYHNFLLSDGHKITLERYRGKGDIRTLYKWTPNTLVYKTIVSRKRYWTDEQGRQSDTRLNGCIGWIDTYFPYTYNMWDVYDTRPESELSKPTYEFTLNADF